MMSLQTMTPVTPRCPARNASFAKKMKVGIGTRKPLLLRDLAWPWACIAPKGTAGKRPGKEGPKW
eukprot:CAMPEP_0204119490 /NCGR_PEP_ID=MMETSP0361-20130328/7135_1 /ASSEMBLY_ACC=CAM_ASM_000343 /TAXON_ID=268821 /ORGANISM="Scrippsiella Hangoei, Strain SHTV-5" /LENGTH=64 /DNA_ID=CAMNT_0051070623 /DNA_START=286 /DNA_END=477 /DNA_ORIENTATION=-